MKITKYFSKLVLDYGLKKRCQRDPSSVIYESAKIINNLKKPDAIRVGAYSHIRGELLTFGHGGNIQVGDYCYLGEHSRVWSAKDICIGNRVLISHNVNIFDNITHPIGARDRHQQFKQIISTGQPADVDLSERPVRIADDVLIGCMSIILAGVTIGEGAIVGAGSVVTMSISPYTVVAGNPAKVIREIPLSER